LRLIASKPQRLSKRQTKLMKYRLNLCGYPSYSEYLDSDHWKRVKEQYRALKLPQECLVCFSPNVDLHHKTYKRLGAERTQDLIPLCRHHHDELHERGLDLWKGPRLLLAERRGRHRPLRVSSMSMTNR
jgi:hypothetical protein